MLSTNWTPEKAARMRKFMSDILLACRGRIPQSSISDIWLTLSTKPKSWESRDFLSIIPENPSSIEITKMKIFLVTLFIALATPTFAQTSPKPDPASKLIEFHMALIKRGPKWSPPSPTAASAVHEQHVNYVISLLQSGKAVIAGPIEGDQEITGIYIFRAKSADEAKSWAMADPGVVAERFTVEMHPWWSEDVMKKMSTPLKLTTAYLAFLVRGDKWTPEKTPATEAIQKAHLENINRLAAMKKLVVAGPFGDNGTLRGIFVFRVGSLEEARELAETDPAVKAGRLALSIHPWMVPEGILP